MAAPADSSAPLVPPSPRGWWRGEVPRWLVAAAAGTLLALAFPLPGLSGLAWVAPGLMLFGGLGLTGGVAFRYGYIAGLALFLGSLRWLLHIPFPSGAVAGWLALSAYCALFPALWVWLGLKLTGAVAAPVGVSQWRQWRQAAAQFAEQTWVTRLWTLLQLGALWVALELVRARFLTGFPWNPLGVTQWQNAPLLQVASVTGVYGVSFLVCWGSLGLCAALLRAVLRPDQRFGWAADLRMPLFAVLAVTGGGFWRIVHRPPAEDARVTLALVQPSIPQQVIWDDAANPARFDKVFGLSEQALATRPDALIWPEGSLPDMTREQLIAMTNLLAGKQAWWIFGSGDAEEAPPGSPTRWRHFNSAFLFSPDGRFADTYRKRQLVIFGEYIPFEHTLPFMKWLTPIGSSFTPGAAPVGFRFGPAGNVVAAPMICFEDAFPHHTRDHVTPETDFLLELTNDGWFGESSAQWQHCANALFRAVENNVPLVRCANNGLTCWIDGFGRMRELNGQAQGAVYAAGFMTTAVPLRPNGQPREMTWYREHGDTFGWICCAVAAGAVVQGIRRPRKTAIAPL